MQQGFCVIGSLQPLLLRLCWHECRRLKDHTRALHTEKTAQQAAALMGASKALCNEVLRTPDHLPMLARMPQAQESHTCLAHQSEPHVCP
jgi:hypothetical protein